MNTILADVHSAYNDIYSVYAALLVPFGTPDFGPKLATALLLIALAVLISFICFAAIQAYRLRTALNVIRGSSNRESAQQKRATFQSRYDTVNAALASNKVTSIAWQEFCKTLIRRGPSQHTIIIAPVRPNNFFNSRNLHVQYDFVRGLPNFFVGLGLLGTFIGLIAALTFSTQSLTSAIDQEQIKAALSRLLTTAAAKFYISAAGLVASLVLSILIKLVLKHLHALVHKINDALDERLLYVSEQTITEQQLSVQQDSLDELKLFNTNIAMKIGDAVRSAIQTSNDGLTDKLSEIAVSFARLVDASGEGAGKAVGDAMRTALDGSLSQASEAIGGIAAALKDLPVRLSVAAESIKNVGAIATQQQALLATKIEENGDEYVKSLSALTAQNEKVGSNLSAISSQIAAASDSVTRASSAVDGNLEKILTGVGDLTHAAAETSRTVRESQEVIRATIATLQQQMSQHLQRFDAVDEKLAGVFTSIGAHLELQSRQMGEQLTTMDQALARAVNQFEQLIDDLTDSMGVLKAAERPASYRRILVTSEVRRQRFEFAI